MKVVVDRSRCIGASNCIGRAPRVFMLDGTRKAFVMDPSGDGDAALLEAARACPTEAIALVEEGSGRRIFPPAAGAPDR